MQILNGRHTWNFVKKELDSVIKNGFCALENWVEFFIPWLEQTEHFIKHKITPTDYDSEKALFDEKHFIMDACILVVCWKFEKNYCNSIITALQNNYQKYSNDFVNEILEYVNFMKNYCIILQHI